MEKEQSPREEEIKEETEDMEESMVEQDEGQEISEEEIYEMYQDVDKKQEEFQTRLEEEIEEVGKRAKSLGLELEKTPLSTGDPRGKLFEQSKEIDEMKDEVKDSVINYKEADSLVIKEVAESEKNKLKAHIKEIKKTEKSDYVNARFGIEVAEKELARIESAIQDMEKGDFKSIEFLLRELFDQELKGKMRGEEGMANIKRAVLIKKV